MSRKRIGRIPPPIALAINVCENAAFYDDSAAFDLMRCFTTVYCGEFPALQPSVFVHIDLTNGRGSVVIKLILSPTDYENEPIEEMSDRVFFEDPRNIKQICFDLGAVTFPAAGEYTVTIYAGDERIAERRIFAVLEP
jgi:hypothetical protein